MEPSTAELSPFRARPTDLAAFLPYACSQLQAPFRVTPLLQNIEEYGSKYDDKSNKSKREKTAPAARLQTSSTQYPDERQESGAVAARDYEDEVVIRMFCDPTDNRPLELVFYRCTQVPRLLMKILGLCIPYHPQLTKITIRWGPLDGFVLYEIARFLPLSQITEICLDDSPLPHCNYFLLLEQPTQLRSLSLARCQLLDEDIALISAQLVYPLPASRTLAILSLESNNITDVGAGALAEMLRTNRSLRHLNLAGNRLTNLGATFIFRTLIQFPLSFDEIALKRKRTFEYLKAKQKTYERCLAILMAPSEAPADGVRGRRRTTLARSRKSSTTTLVSVGGAEALACRADAMANELIGPNSEPFDCHHIITRDDVPYCVGNFSLCYLNLAYNELDYGCAARLADVLAYQAGLRGAGPGGPGLLRVVLEGSREDVACAAAAAAAAELERAVAAAAELAALQQIRPGRKSERVKVKSS